MALSSSDTFFDLYQQPLLFVIPVGASSLSTLEQLITAHTPYKHPLKHPSVYWTDPQEGLGIDQVRQIESEFAYAPLDGTTRIFALANFELATLEAQNALLKLLEYPSEHTQFWLITDQTQAVLPTIQSRCMIIQAPAELVVHQSITETEMSDLFNKIVAASLSECISLAGKYTERGQALTLVVSLLTWLVNQTDFVPTARQLNTLNQTYLYLKQGVNVKLALESAFFGLSGHTKHLKS